MARRDASRQSDVEELEDGPDPSESTADRGPVIQLDPDAPRETPRSSVRAQSTLDTVIPHEDLYKARDEVERLLGGFRALATAFTSATPDTAGKENILGVGVGFRLASGTLTAEPAVKVFVRDKLPLALVAASARIPTEVAGIPTDVEAIGQVVLHSYAKRFPRPVPCGVSCSHVTLPGSGTLGCLAVLKNNRLVFLSNNHVIANENAAQQGDDIIQPGNAEPVPAPDQVIGRLENFVPIQANGNLVDAAVAWTAFSRVQRNHVTYSMNPNPVAAALGMTVMKNGRTTQSTIGAVVAMGVNIFVPYTPFPAGAEMRDQIAIQGIGGVFSRPGDSGSVIVTAGTKQPVALLFAGSGDNRFTFANPIGAVMNALGIDRFLGP